MHFFRFTQRASVCLLSLPFSDGRVANRLVERLGLLVKRVPSGVCTSDAWYTAVSTQSDNTALCATVNSSPNATVTTYYTPTM
jgi:hypothetical protein